MDGARYGAPPAEALLLRPLDALTAVYHRPSGRTHVVASPVPELLEALAAAGPLTVAALLDALGERFDLADADPARLAARLEELVAAGLVSRA